MPLRSYRHSLLAGGALMLAVAAVPAQQREAPIGELTPFVGYRFGGELDAADGEGGVELEAAPSAGVLIDVFARGNASYQLLYSRQATDFDLETPAAGPADGEIVVHAIQFGGTYRSDRESFQPYLAATLGATVLSTSGEGGRDDTFFSGSLGVGVNLRPTKRLDLRLEGRAYGTLVDADTSLFCQTGPQQNVCAVRVEASLLLQFETFAGFTIRF